MLATKLFGAAGLTELFFAPCALLAILPFRAEEAPIARGLTAVLFLAFVALHGRYGAPLACLVRYGACQPRQHQRAGGGLADGVSGVEICGGEGSSRCAVVFETQTPGALVAGDDSWA